MKCSSESTESLTSRLKVFISSSIYKTIDRFECEKCPHILFKNFNSDSKFGRHSFSVDFFISMVKFLRNTSCIFASDPPAVLSRKGTP